MQRRTASEDRCDLTAVEVAFEVNGKPLLLAVDSRRTLLDLLRQDCGLTGPKKGCDTGNCGACTVLVDGEAVYGCLVLAVECEGRSIMTVEGLGSGGALDPLQTSFIEHDALQCGYCTPGQLMSLKALLNRPEPPSDDEIIEAVAGNLCRCGAYRNILNAARATVDDRRCRSSEEDRPGDDRSKDD